MRFEVFKRDSFTCQYCGRKAPDIILEVDHIEPIAGGGSDDLFNLITSCEDCNAGKSDRRLADNTVVERQRDQLAKLQERKEQIEMMFEWQQSLVDLDAQALGRLGELISAQMPGFSLSQHGEAALKKCYKRFGLDEVLAAVYIACEHYLERDEAGAPTKESVERALSKIGGICFNRKQGRENPELAKLYHIRAILRNRLTYCNDWMAMQHMREALAVGIGIDELEELAKESPNWTYWRRSIESWIKEATEEPDGHT